MLCQGDWNISLKGCILFSPLFRKIHTCVFPPSICCHSHVFSENEPTHPQLGCRAAFALPNPARPWLMDWGRRSDLIWANWMICPDDWNWVMLMLPTPSWDQRFVWSGTVGATKYIEKLRNNCKREGWIRWAGRSRGVCVWWWGLRVAGVGVEKSHFPLFVSYEDLLLLGSLKTPASL